MTDPSSLPSRRFNEKEVAQIIKRASELQQEDSPIESSAGMSLVELEQVAREAGLDPALVLERTIDGEVSSDEYEALVLEIQRELGGVGSASTFGRSLQWTMRGVDRRRISSRVVQVTVSPRNGRTTIRIEEPLG